MPHLHVSNPNNQLTDFGEVIFLDRYAAKDIERNVEKDDLVLVCTNESEKQREIAWVEEKLNDDKIRVRLIDGSQMDVAIEKVDKPIELSPEQTFDRVAKDIASIEREDQKKHWESEFRWLLDEWKFVPGGRILSSAGTGQDTTYLNCFVLPMPHDSRQGIAKTMTEQMEIMSRGGGVGVTLSSLRPRHAIVKGVNGRSSGAVSWGGLLSYVTGLIEQAGCLAPYVRVLTNQGHIKIEELVERIEKGEAFEAWTHKGWKKITDSFRNGVKEVFRMTLDNGSTLDATANHRIQTLREDGEFELIPLSELKVGDNVLTIMGDEKEIEADEISLVKMKLPTNIHPQSKPIDFPDRMTPELAYLTGFYMANGHLRIRNVSNDGSSSLTLAVSQKRLESKKRLVNIIKQCFGSEPAIYQGDGAVEILSFASKTLVDYWVENNLKKPSGAISSFVPEQIWKSSPFVQTRFLSGYFDGDGCNRGTKGGFGIDTISYEMAQSIQIMLAGLGVASKLHTFERKEENWNTLYRVNVTGFWATSKMKKWLLSEKIGDKEQSKTNVSNKHPYNFHKKYRPYVGRNIDKILASNGKNTSQTAIQFLRENRELLVGTEVKEHFQYLDKCVPHEIISIESLGKMETYDITVDEVHMLSAGNIYVSNSRRGALMCVLDDWHPDILEFIHAKKDFSKITNANISVAISDEFMEAVKNDEDWHLVFPDTQHPRYDSEWDGDLEKWRKKELPILHYKTLKARDMWSQIIEGAWSSAEPGLWFKGRTNQLSNSWYFAPLIGCNPCGEKPLPAYGVCDLGSLNLPKFLNHNGSDLDWNKFSKAIKHAVRFLDNVLDITYYPLEQNEERALTERRIGLGTMGLGELLIRLQIRYGSDDSVKFIDKLYSFIQREAYTASIELAKEKGAFPEFHREKYIKSEYIKTLPEDLQEDIWQYGTRNVTVLTQPPNGTTATQVNTSTGIEPFFAWEFNRKSRLGIHTERVKVYDEWLQQNKGQKLPDYFVSAMEMTPEEHVKVQAAIQKYVDSAISKTCNVPKDYTLQQTRELYEKMYELGCKGGTIYRDGSRSIQVLSLKGEEKEAYETATKRPRVLECDIHHSTNGWVFFVGLTSDGKPYEIFGGPKDETEISRLDTKGKLIKNKKQGDVAASTYNLVVKDENGKTVRTVRNIGNIFNNHIYVDYTRMISLALRHGAKPSFAAEQLTKNKQSDMYSFSKAIARVLKKYVDDGVSACLKCENCGQKSVVYQEGCHVCQNCAHSTCS